MTKLADTIKAWQDNGTQGPWRKDGPKHMTITGEVYRIINGENLPAAFTPAWYDAEEEAEANAALIIQAPRMARVVMAAMELAERCEASQNPLVDCGYDEALAVFKETVKDE